jgi:hypothetical protein
MKSDNLIYLFHHIHHGTDEHKVHHCGGKHEGIDYEIWHCKCELHRIDKKIAIGHGANQEEIKVEFVQQCPEGGWHIESGEIIS